MTTATPDVHLFQIAYSAETLAEVQPGYALLDNRDNLRPDWYEYWPIRRHLLAGGLDEQAFYGFFSPRFGRKTGLSHAQVQAFVRQAAPRADVVLFSPQSDMGGLFLNVFEQAETFDAGLIAAFEPFLAAIGQPASLRTLVMDSRQTVFSNYFVARPVFWRRWLALGEAFFAVCEDPTHPLQPALTQATSYFGAQRKVFLMERLASLLLTTEPHWRSVAHDPYGFGLSDTRTHEYRVEAVISDALKLALREQGFAEYRQVFALLRRRFVAMEPSLGRWRPAARPVAAP